MLRVKFQFAMTSARSLYHRVDMRLVGPSWKLCEIRHLRAALSLLMIKPISNYSSRSDGRFSRYTDDFSRSKLTAIVTLTGERRRTSAVRRKLRATFRLCLARWSTASARHQAMG